MGLENNISIDKYEKCGKEENSSEKYVRPR